MPPLKTFIFECISDAQITVTIPIYGNHTDAKKRLAHHVKNVHNFRFKK